MTDRRRYNLIARISEGDCPRATHREYEELRQLDHVGDQLQMESALAADTSGGYIVTPLRSLQAYVETAKAWIAENPKPKRAARSVAKPKKVETSPEVEPTEPAYRCYCCGEPIGNSVLLVSYEKDVDRVFLFKPEHADRAEATCQHLALLSPGRRA